MPDKLYATRDSESLGQLYFQHVEAMTAERLHEKSDIAAELAFRDAEIGRLSKPGKINIIMESDGGGNYDPILVTFDAARAKQKYFDVIIAEDNVLEPALVPMLEVRTSEGGIEYGTLDGEEYVKVDDGTWYELSDQYGDKIALWFETEVE